MYCVLIAGQTIRVTKLFLAELMVCFKTKNKPFGQLSRLVICNLCWKIRRNFGRHLLGVTICAGEQNASELRHSQITPNKMNYYLPGHPDDTEELWCCHFMSGYEVLPVLAKTACCFLGVTEVCCVSALHQRFIARFAQSAGLQELALVVAAGLSESPQCDLWQREAGWLLF